MILDSSAIIALICNEAGTDQLLRKLGNAKVIAVGAPTVAETQLALSVKLGRDSGALVEQLLVEVPSAGGSVREQISAFFAAHLRYGKGRHPARPNIGDCFTYYAIAKVAGMPVL